MSDPMELWQAYFADRSDGNRNRLATHYFTFVRKTIRSMTKRYRSLDRFEMDDLESWALEALLRKAIPNYQPDRGASPETFIRRTIWLRFRGEIRSAREAAKDRPISLATERDDGYFLTQSAHSLSREPVDQLIETEEPTLYAPLHDALAKLTPTQRETVIAAFWEGRNDSEIAQQRGICRKAAHWTLNRAIERLRELLAVPTDQVPRITTKIAPAKVQMIREKHAAGASFKSIARDVGVHWTTVKRIVEQPVSTGA